MSSMKAIILSPTLPYVLPSNQISVHFIVAPCIIESIYFTLTNKCTFY